MKKSAHFKVIFGMLFFMFILNVMFVIGHGVHECNSASDCGSPTYWCCGNCQGVSGCDYTSGGTHFKFCCEKDDPCGTCDCDPYNGNSCSFAADCSGGGCNEQCADFESGGPCPGDNEPPCSHACGECGVNDCGEACEDTCGKFKSGCSDRTCTYYFANISASATTPCINTTSASRKVTVSGLDHYCGNLTITVSTSAWNEIREIPLGTATREYEFTFNVPAAEIQRYVDTKQPATITVRGDRNTIKDSKDETTYDCDKTLYVAYTFDNFYYCPTYAEFETQYQQAGFDYYNETSYYTFLVPKPQGYFEWDSCASNPLLDTCSPDPKDCVDLSRNSYPLNTSANPDNDNEYEVCISKNGIQGGWMDADSGRNVCKNVTNKLTKWYDCTNIGQCQHGINDFYAALQDPKINGLCCGDDFGEIPLTSTKTDTSGAPYYMPGLFTSCCTSAFSCVDREGVCRKEGDRLCLNEGQMGSCHAGVWTIFTNTSCQKPCLACNVNTELSPYTIDVNDLAALQNAIDHTISDWDDPLYDTNKDGNIDQADYGYCLPFKDQICNTCADGVFLPVEECQVNLTTGKVDFHNDIAPPLRCDDKISFTRDNTTCFPSCDANYTSKCVKGQCGASCGSDLDCTTDITLHDYRCNPETCACETIGCAVGTTLCVDGTCSANCTKTDTGAQGCIDEDEVCEFGEGCACPDCLNQRDSCITGAICGSSEFCTCPLGTLLCLDGTCSYDCTKTDTGEQGCIVENTICEPGEGCGCVDCDGKQDSCILGGVCNFVTGQCEQICTITEEVEITLNDGIDNDCDGLVDEPEFWPGYGVYVWEAGCTYYMCAHGDDSREHNTTGILTVSGDYKIYRLRQFDWESEDSFTLTSDGKQVTFRSKLYNDLDCLSFKSDTMVRYDLTLDGSKDTSRIYLTQNKNRPLNNPFYFSSPDCALGCLSPSGCGSPSTFCGITGCGFERCIFDCGGYWINGSAGAICTFLDPTSGDTCADCVQNMSCSNYTNVASCTFDPCNGALTPFGCKWTAAGKCVDNFDYCKPGTTLCKDGTCSQDCKKTDWKNAECIGLPDKKCVVGEGCWCSDCNDKRDTCTFGAICGSDKLCGCPLNTTLCNDNTCDYSCANHGGKTGCLENIANGVCDFGEGCACQDCDTKKDSCVPGGICFSNVALCMPRVREYCDKGTTLCKDYTCDDTCENNGGKKGCSGLPDGRCDVGEGCACEDCDTRRDSCKEGLYCNFEDKLCDGDSVISPPGCTDSDNDGYSKYQNSCLSGNDCDDANSMVNPGMIEICNGKDDNCNNKVDEDCTTAKLDLVIDPTQKVRVLDTFKLKMKFTNLYASNLENMKVVLQLPSKFKAKSNSVTLTLTPKETKEVTFDITVEDYTQETASLTLKAQIGTEDITSKEIPLKVEIPGFAILPMPGTEQVDGDNVCFDFYYVLNEQDGNYDIEMDILDPSSFFGKSVLVDYVTGIEADGSVIIEQMLSNPYCLPSGKEYELGGYLYKEGMFGVVANVETKSVYLRT